VTGNLYRCTISPGIAEVCSNVSVIPGFFPADFKRHQDQELAPPPEIGVTFLAKNLPRRQAYPALGFGGMHGEPRGDVLCREHNLFGSVKAKMELSELHDHPTITVNKPYYRLGKLRIGEFYPPGIHLRDVLAVGLIRAGYQPLFGSAFAASGEGTLVISPPGIGKTLILLQAMKQGFQYLADDLVIADSNSYLHPCLSVSSFAYELGKMTEFHRYRSARFWKIKFLDFLSRKVPLAGLLFQRPYLDISFFTQEIEMAREAKTRFIFILARGSSRVEKLSDVDALRMLMIINRLVFSYPENQLLLAYSLLNPWLNLPELRQAEERLLQKLIGGANCFLCVAPSPDEYFSLIQQNI